VLHPLPHTGEVLDTFLPTQQAFGCTQQTLRQNAFPASAKNRKEVDNIGNRSALIATQQ
jgi:hypothetical protein